MTIQKALEDIRNGKPILVFDFDDREKETDMTIASEFITPEILGTFRRDGGGLICTTTPYKRAMEVGLPFMSDVFWDDSDKYPLLAKMAPTDIPYDRTRSSFGLTINHRKTFTGITDRDRALTIKAYADVLFQDKPIEEIQEDMGRNFRAPGHVHLLNTSDEILGNRFGHTELCTALMYMAGVKPSATICEMMSDDGGSKTKEDVLAYAQENGLSFITGEQVVEAWKKFKEETGFDQ